MAKQKRILSLIAAIVLLSLVNVNGFAKDKPDDKSFSTFVKYLKSNYQARGQSTFGMVTFARFLVKVIKPAGVKNFKVNMLRDLQFTNAKVDSDLGSFIRANVHQDWRPLTQVVSLRNNQYVYVYFMPEKEDAKFLVVAVQQKDAFVVQFKFDTERLAKFIEKPEIMGISLTGDDNKNNQNNQVNVTTDTEDEQKKENKDNATASNKTDKKNEEPKKPDYN
jgi:hypothetical protein